MATLAVLSGMRSYESIAEWAADLPKDLLKNPKRVAGLLFVYFLALLLWALIERELRTQMKLSGIDKIPLYPELRDCHAPTTDGVVQALHGVRRHRLLDANDKPVRVFYDEISDVARQRLTLLGVSRQHYGADE